MPHALVDRDECLDWDDSRPDEPARPTRRRPFRWLGTGLLSALLVGALAYLAEQRAARQEAAEAVPVPASTLVAPPPTWTPFPEAPPLYAFGGLAAPAFEARRHAGGGREDVLVAGTLGDVGYAQLTVRRGIAEPPASSFYVDLVRQAAAAGLSVVRSGQAVRLDTKFGPAETAGITLAGPVEQACQAIRFLHPEVSFSVHGWLCGGEARPVTDADLACLMDRLVLTGSEDPALRVLFAQAERRRLEACSPPPAQVAGIRRP
jgi:hypothetical protein